MRVRFGDRLTVRKVINTDTLDVLVPQFILQPLVENAFDHGISRTPGAGTIEITAASRDGKLELSVSDDGIANNGTSAQGKKHGIGLTNTQLRLEQLYGNAQSMSLEKLSGRGTRVTVGVPWRVATQAETTLTGVA